LQAIQDAAADSEGIFRSLVALGTALSIGTNEIKAAAKQVFGVKEALQVVKKSAGKENRIREVITEIEASLA
jgi:phospholipase A-2-activating protein